MHSRLLLQICLHVTTLQPHFGHQNYVLNNEIYKRKWSVATYVSDFHTLNSMMTMSQIYEK